jgi:exopolyphosphatase/guanosine-5'-triphosphate,3'-diphosphate pyrophosphatase
MRLATIDLGSNTVRLLVADADGPGRWTAVDEHQQVTRLGAGLRDTGYLGEGPMARAAAVVTDYVARARGLGAGGIRIVATSAVREAANGAAFAARLQALTGAPVEIVSGEDEARLTVLGIHHGLGWVPGLMLAFDIGGGSTEYIVARDGAVTASVSLRLGVVPLAERYPFPDLVPRPAYRALADEVGAQLDRDWPAAIRDARPDVLIGTAGTVTTLAALDLGLARYDAARVQGHRLRRADVEALRDHLGALTVAQRGTLPCLEPGRADLIIPGIAIVLETMHRCGAADLLVSDWGLREGMMVEATGATR